MTGSVAVERMTAAIRAISAGQAELMSALVQIADETPVAEFAPMEIAAGATWTRQAATAQLVLAQDLVERLPAVHAALSAGVIDLPKARVIVDGVSVVGTAVARQVCELILPVASGLTTGQIKARLEKLILEADPAAAVNRHKEKLNGRRVVFESAGDGCANVLGLDLPADKARAAADRINALARLAKIGGDPRTADQLRADTMVSLLLGSVNRAPAKGGVEITASLQTLTALYESPGDLNGYGPVIADIARQVAAQQRDATWTYSVRDPQTGEFFHGTTRTRPTPVSADSPAPPKSAPQPSSADGMPGPRPSSGDRLADARSGPRPSSGDGLADARSRPRPSNADSLGEAKPTPAAAQRDPAGQGHAQRSEPTSGSTGDNAQHLGSAVSSMGNKQAQQRGSTAGAAGDKRGQQRKPSAAMVREVRARDRTCRAPGCRVPATHCDLDHVHDWSRGGITAPCNLATLCRHHHRAKHEGFWTLTQDKPGHYTWRSPLGRIYKIFPEPPPS